MSMTAEQATQLAIDSKCQDLFNEIDSGIESAATEGYSGKYFTVEPKLFGFVKNYYEKLGYTVERLTSSSSYVTIYWTKS